MREAWVDFELYEGQNFVAETAEYEWLFAIIAVGALLEYLVDVEAAGAEVRNGLAVLERLGSDQEGVQLDLLLKLWWDGQLTEFLVALSGGLVGFEAHGYFGEGEEHVDLVDLVVALADLQLLGQEPACIENLPSDNYVYLGVSSLEGVLHEVVDDVVGVVHFGQLLLLKEELEVVGVLQGGVRGVLHVRQVLQGRLPEELGRVAEPRLLGGVLSHHVEHFLRQVQAVQTLVDLEGVLVPVALAEKLRVGQLEQLHVLRLLIGDNEGFFLNINYRQFIR